MATKIWRTQEELALELLRNRKYASAKSKLDWLQDALEFARASQKANAKKLNDKN